jgi:hypothetical protein
VFEIGTGGRGVEGGVWLSRFWVGGKRLLDIFFVTAKISHESSKQSGFHYGSIALRVSGKGHWYLVWIISDCGFDHSFFCGVRLCD